MKRIWSVLLFTCLIWQGVSCQIIKQSGSGILFHGLVMDGATLSPIANSQILINRSFLSVSDQEGAFAFWVNRRDTIVFRSLGYKSVTLFISDTLVGREFMTGIYMNTDTLSIGEIIIVPRLANLKSDLLNTRTESRPEIENAKYNLAVSAYQGKQSQSILGDPGSNYELLRQKQRINAFEKGGIPSDKIIGLSPFMLLPAAYLLIHGLPEKPAPLKSNLTRQEVDQIQKKYLETLKQKNQ